jgi:DNA polymerase III subunit gamma/tau
LSLDDKYRPRAYSDVLGQKSTISVLKELVKKRQGFRQSYVFAGQFGSGKTTQARIFARALLCESPVDGEACDKCPSCLTMLDPMRTHEDFVEVDAANHSKKEDIAQIVEDIKYGSFSGRQRLYLFDESHELSKSAMDALLLPLENTRPGTEDKQLVCIFCTTEPSKMRGAILSRCAPVFKIEVMPPDAIADYLAMICDKEGFEYEPQALKIIAESTECHIRDCLKALEGISTVGKVDVANVTTYLQMDANPLLLDVLDNIGGDFAKVLDACQQLSMKVSPATAYESLAELSMLAYRTVHAPGVAIPSFWDSARIKQVGTKHSEFLIQFAQVFGSRPAHSNHSMLLCDISSLHQKRTGLVVQATSTQVVNLPVQQAQGPEIGHSQLKQIDLSNSAPIADQKPSNYGNMEPVVTALGVYVDPRAQGLNSHVPTIGNSKVPALSSNEFADILHRRVVELTEENRGGSSRRNNVGSS